MAANRAEFVDNAIVNRRRIGAPPADVFAAFADPARLARWWGPAGFTNEFQVCEFRPGGAWRFTMRAPDGTAFTMEQQFVEIVPPRRIVVRHRQSGHDFTLSIDLQAAEGATDVAWRLVFDAPAEAQRVGDFVRRANEENLDRLAAEVARRLSAGDGPAR